MRQLSRGLIALSVCWLLAACSGTGSPASRASSGSISAAALTFSASSSSVTADGTSAIALTATLKDSSGNPVEGKTVNVTSSRGATDTLSAPFGVSDSAGVVTFTATSAIAGTATYTAVDTSDALTATSPAVAFTAGPAATNTSTLAAETTSVADDGVSTATLVVTLRDANSNPVANKTVTLSSSRGTNTDTISAASGPSTAAGIVTFTVTSTTAGTSTYTALDAADAMTIPETATVTYNLGPVSATASTVVANPTAVVADGTTTSTIKVTLTDATGNPISGKTVTLASSRVASDNISAASGPSDNNGVVTFTVSSLTLGTSIYTAVDTTDAFTLTQTPAVTFTPGPVSILQSTVVANPASIIGNGVPVSTITVTLVDAYSNPVPGKTVTLVSSRGASDIISSSSGPSSALGIVTFSVSSKTVGVSTYTATDSTDSMALTETASVTYTVGPVSASASTIFANTAVTPGNGSTPNTIRVTLEDSMGNPVSGKTVTLVSNRGSADTISAASGPSSSLGTVTFTVISATAGVATFTATDTTDSIVITQTASITFNSPDHLVYVSGNSQSKSPGSTLSPFVVEVVDSSGRIYTGGVALTLDTVLGSDAEVIGSPTVISNSSGVASFTTFVGWNSLAYRWKIFSATNALPDTAASGHKMYMFSATVNTTRSGTFTQNSHYSATYTPALTLGFFSGNSTLSFIATDLYGGAMFFVNNGNASFSSTSPNLATGGTPNAIVTGDFNQDGIQDVATINVSDNTTSVLLAKGSLAFANPVEYSAGASITCAIDPVCGIVAADINGDGTLDLLLADQEAGQIGVLTGQGNGTFNAATLLNTGSGSSPINLAAADLRQTGVIDIVVANYSTNTVGVFLGHGDGTFAQQVTYAVGTNPSAVVIADFNHDGIPDLAVSNEGGTVSVLLGNGDGTFQPQSTYAAGSKPLHINTGDFNGDGNIDLVVANFASNTISVYLGNGDGTFAPQVTYATDSEPLYVQVGDFNGDGKLDLGVSCLTGYVDIFMGN